MTLWHTVLIASVIVCAMKVVGHSVPSTLIDGPRPRRIIDLVTVSLLAALIAVQTFGQGQALTIDARVPAVVVAIVLFWLRAPFIVVIVVAAALAAVLRRFVGWE